MSRDCVLKTVLFGLLAIAAGVVGAQNEGWHELRVGVGTTIVLKSHRKEPVADSFLPGIAGRQMYYKGNEVGTPAINLSYFYQVNKWLAVGGTLGYVGMFQKEYNLYDHSVYSKHSWHFIGFTPMARFDWFRVKIARLYSIVGLGLGYDYERQRYVQSGQKWSNGLYMPTLDFTPLGIAIGGRLFGFCELGASSHGFVKVGAGYRFNNKSKR